MHGLAPDAVEVLVGPAGVQQVAGREGLELAGAEVVDDQAVQDRAEIVAKPPLALVGAGQLAGQQLGPEFLEDLVGQMLVADLQVDVARDGIVVSADQLFHGRLALGPGGMGAADRRPVGRDFGQPLFCHRNDPTAGQASPRRQRRSQP